MHIKDGVLCQEVDVQVGVPGVVVPSCVAPEHKGVHGDNRVARCGERGRKTSCGPGEVYAATG